MSCRCRCCSYFTVRSIRLIDRAEENRWPRPLRLNTRTWPARHETMLSCGMFVVVATGNSRDYVDVVAELPFHLNRSVGRQRRRRRRGDLGKKRSFLANGRPKDQAGRATDQRAPHQSQRNAPINDCLSACWPPVCSQISASDCFYVLSPGSRSGFAGRQVQLAAAAAEAKAPDMRTAPSSILAGATLPIH